MGIASNIRMNLDFMFNASNAEKGFAKMKGGFGDLGDAAKAFTKSADTAAIGWGGMFNTLYKNLKETSIGTEGLSKILSELGGSAFGSEIERSLEEIYVKQLSVISGMKQMRQENAAFAANATMIEVLKRSSAATDDLAKQYTDLGIVFDKSKITARLIELHNQSEKTFNKFNDVMEQSRDLATTLSVKQLAQYRQHMQFLNDALDGGELSMKEYIKSQDRLNYRFDVMNNKLPKLKEQVGNLFSGATGQFMSVLGVMASVTDAIDAQDKAVQTIHQTALQNSGIFYGQAREVQDFTKTVREMDDAIRDVGFATQVSMSKAAESMAALAQARVPGTVKDLKQLTITSIQMQQAFGMSEGQATDLFKTLSLAGRISPKGIKEVAEAFADVQATLGLTAEEATEAGAAVGSIINRMSAMGASSVKNAKIVAKEVATMTATFTRAGLSAQDASQMMDRFMDPTRLEDNAFLWSQMGISVADALQVMTGDAGNMEGMTKKLMQASIDLKKQYGDNPLALQAMAEAYGMTIQQVNQLSGEYERQLKLGPQQRKEMEAQATLEKQAAQAKESLSKKIEQLAAIGNVFLASFVMPLLDFITPIISGIMNIVTSITSLLDAMGPFGNIVKGALGAFLLFTLLTRINAIKMLLPINGVAGAFSGVLSSAKSLAVDGVKAIGSFASQAAKKLGDSPLNTAISGLGDKLSSLGAPKRGAFGIEQTAPQGPSSKIGSGPKSPAGDLKAPTVPDTGALDKGSAAMDKISKIPAGNIMQLSVAILAIAGAVFLLALSFKILVDVVKASSPGELLAGFGLLAGAMLLVAGAVFLLGKVSVMAGPGLLILGGSLLMIGAAMALVIGATALLFNSLKGLSNGQLTAGITAIITVMTAFVITIAILAAVSTLAGPPLLALGGAIALMGLGIVLAGFGIKLFVDAINSMGKDFAAQATSLGAAAVGLTLPLLALGVAATLAFLPLTALGLAAVILGAGMAVVAASIATIADGMKGFVDGLVYVANNAVGVVGGLITLAVGLGLAFVIFASIVSPVTPVLLTIAAVVAIVGIGFIMAGIGLKYFAEALIAMGSNIGATLLGILSLGAAIVVIAGAVSVAMIMLAWGFAAAIIQLAAIAPVAAGVTGVMLAFGTAIILVGLGIIALGFGLSLMADAFKKFGELGGSIISTALSISGALIILSGGMLAVAVVGSVFGFALLGIVAMIPALALIGLGMMLISDQFLKMGVGIQLFASNISAALTGIDALYQRLSNSKGLADNFVTEIQKMTDALDRLSGSGSVGINAISQIDIAPSKASSAGDNTSNSEMMRKMDEVTSSLKNIDKNTDSSAKTLEKILSRMSQGASFNSSVTVNMPGQ